MKTLFQFARVPTLSLSFIVLLTTGARAASWDSVNLYGYFDLDYRWTNQNKFYKSGPDDPNLKNGAFDQRHLNILTDIAVNPNLAVKTHIEFEHGIHPSADSASVIMEYGFGEYKFSDALKARGGKMLTPFGIFSEIHDATPAYLAVSPPETFYRSVYTGGHMLMPKWITGLALMGELSVFSSMHDVEYIIYIANGESRFTTNESEQDDNPNKSVGGRVQFSTAGESLMFGMAGYMGDKALRTEELRIAHISFSAFASLTMDGYNLTGEFGRSKLGTTTQVSWYLQASAKYGRVTPYIRLETLDPSDLYPEDFWSILVGGINLSLTDTMFFKAEWNENRRARRNVDIIDGEARNFGEFRSAITLMF